MTNKISVLKYPDMNGIDFNEYIANKGIHRALNPKLFLQTWSERFPAVPNMTPHNPAMILNLSDNIKAFSKDTTPEDWQYWRNALHYARELDKQQRSEWTRQNFIRIENAIQEQLQQRELNNRNIYFELSLKKALMQSRILHLASLIRYDQERQNTTYRFMLRDAAVQEELERSRMHLDKLLNQKAEDSRKITEEIALNALRNQRDWEYINAIKGQQNYHYIQLQDLSNQRSFDFKDLRLKHHNQVAAITGSTTKKVS